MMKRMLIGSVVALAMASGANASMMTGWEASEGYTSGSTFAGVNGWQRVAGASDSEAVIVSSPVHEGSQAAKIERSGGTGVRLLNGFDPVTQSPRIEAWLAFTRTSTNDAASYLYFGDVEVARQNLNSTAVQFGFGRNGGSNKNEIFYRDGSTSRYAGVATEGEYYHFVADVDLTTSTYDLTVTGPGIDFSDTGIAFRGGSAQELTSLLMLGNSRDVQFYVDGLSVTGADAIPEPATMTLLGLGGLAGLARRRRV